jgi:hypothetical protein
VITDFFVEENSIDIYAPKGNQGVVVFHIETGDLVYLSQINGVEFQQIFKNKVSVDIFSEKFNIDQQQALTILNSFVIKGMVTPNKQC